jgi:hypothetical protein
VKEKMKNYYVPQHHRTMLLAGAESWAHYNSCAYPTFGLPGNEDLIANSRLIGFLHAQTAIDFRTEFIIEGEAKIETSNKLKDSLSDLFRFHFWKNIKLRLHLIRNFMGLFGMCFVMPAWSADKGFKFKLLSPNQFTPVFSSVDDESLDAVFLHYVVDEGGYKSWQFELLTPETRTIYKSIKIENSVYDYDEYPYSYKETFWKAMMGMTPSDIDRVIPNELGTIPGVLFTNHKKSSTRVVSLDLDGRFKLLKAIDLVYAWMQEANSREAFPIKVFKDAIPPSNINTLQSGEALEVHSTMNEETQELVTPQIEILEASGKFQAYIRSWVEDAKMLFYESLGVTINRMKDVTNKGNVTSEMTRSQFTPAITKLTPLRDKFNEGLLDLFILVAKMANMKGLIELPIEPDEIKFNVDLDRPRGLHYMGPGDRLTESQMIQSGLNLGILTIPSAIKRFNALLDLDPTEEECKQIEKQIQDLKEKQEQKENNKNDKNNKNNKNKDAEAKARQESKESE